ncbi:hypothetical protein L6R52_20935, partial [Myxococcota bacterium]|nr:hypothetical protein [Myxococcota bacterium]
VEDAAPDASDPAPDAGDDAGTTAPDAGTTTPDASTPDAGACDPGALGDPDKPRVMLIGHGFGATSGQDGTEIRSLTIGADGTPVDDGVRLDVGTKPRRIRFVPDGTRALVLGEDGMLVSVSIDGAQNLAVLDRVMLPAAGYGELVVTSDGLTAFAVGSNVDETSGISTIHLGCLGELAVETQAFFNVRLSAALALLPGEQRAVLLGGQTVFEPIDADDLRLLERTPSGWAAVDTFDVWMDFVDAGNIAVSPDGATLLVPNGSPFSTEAGQISIVSIQGDTLTEIDRLTGLDDVREVVFSPDGATALASRFQPGRVAVLADLGAGLVVQRQISGIGLADQMEVVRRGALSGRVYIPSVDPNGGPNVAMLRIDGRGMVTDLGQVELGGGAVNIPDSIAITP